MQKGVKFRIYPNKEQQTIINQTLGCCRLIYNKGLAMRDEAYQNGNKIGYSQTSAMLTDLKKSDEHDRDTNASINILNKGLQMQSA